MARRDTIVGLDVGHYAVKAVWAARRDDALVVKRAELLRLPTDGSDIQGVIGPWIETMGIQDLPCVLNVPGQQVLFQPFLLPPGDPRTLQQAAEMEVLRFDELASESMVCGYAPFALKEGEQRLLLAMARQAVIDELLAAARERKLNVIDVIPSSVAIFNALCGKGKADATPGLFIDIGSAGTAIAIGSSVGLMFARAFAAGGQAFTDSLARSRGLSANQAEHLKVTEGSLAEGSPASADLTQTAEMWISEVQSCLSLYNLLFPEPASRVGRVILAGGAARLPGLAAWVTSRLNVNVVVLDQLPGIAGDKNAADFAVACGLAATGLGLGLSPVSLLPAMLKNELTFRRQKPFWIAAGVAAALILGVSLLGGSRDIRRKAAHLSEQRSSLSRRQQLVVQMESIKAKDEEIRRMAQPVQEMLRSAAIMRDLITLISKAKAPSDSIVMVCDADTYFSGRAARVPAAARPPSRRGQRQDDANAPVPMPRLERVMIEGTTRKTNLSTVRELISKIKEAGFVESADLLNDDQLVANPDDAGGPNPKRGQRFVIDVKIAAL